MNAHPFTLPIIMCHCAKCNTVTPHEEVYDDPYFEYGLWCKVCDMVWEAVLPNDEVKN